MMGSELGSNTLTISFEQLAALICWRKPLQFRCIPLASSSLSTVASSSTAWFNRCHHPNAGCGLEREGDQDAGIWQAVESGT
ncbi:hypothetical protein ABEF92_004848 [Exophiala dermatitidis]|uniref:Uncharacterized protein n=1 Tax=Exophiala dermatitidis (strain ATCC 34100 / CBS 525.76 / NIH/UT8656) TaxID=858893 RepID=H6CB03_EXODN|nr:uncharacterized protein HMPREF1120_08892 [Exophiala dermatitidis NIH/UT8656]EHY60950.1 hypothetical protein HMPREF1120_08892 [Exophiala dermatitidis NIH/UT8656]